MTDREMELVAEFMAGLDQVKSAILELAKNNRTMTFGAVYTYAKQASLLLGAILDKEHTADCKH